VPGLSTTPAFRPRSLICTVHEECVLLVRGHSCGHPRICYDCLLQRHWALAAAATAGNRLATCCTLPTAAATVRVCWLLGAPG
jgi:hypothetical protein